MTKRDYYEVLSVTRTASGEEIKKAYRKVAMQYHPDRNPGDAEAADRFKEATEAFEILADEQKRPLYDRHGHAAFANGSGGAGGHAGTVDLGDIFGDLLGSFFGGGGRRRRPAAGRPPARAGRAGGAGHRADRGGQGRQEAGHHQAGGHLRAVRRDGCEAGQQAGGVQAMRRAGRRHPETGLLPGPVALPVVQRLGADHRRPVRQLQGRGPHGGYPDDRSRGAGRGGHRRPHPLHRHGRRRRPRGVPRRSGVRHPGPRTPLLPARRAEPDLPVAGDLQPGGARGDRRNHHARRREGGARVAAGRADARGRPAAGARAAVPPRRPQGRLARPGRPRHAADA